MRLGQLARKLAVKPAEIVEFLVAKQIQAEEGVNTRLEDEHIALIVQQFAPSMAQEIITAESIIKEDGESEPVVVVESLPETMITGNKPIVKEEPPLSQPEDDRTEVIKAAKVELPGLKVLGKIELPDPVKKKPAEQEVTESAEAGPSPVAPSAVEKRPRPEGRRNAHQKTERRDQRPRKNPVALQREREAEEADKKRQEEAELAKKRKTEHYLRKVNVSGPTKAAKLYNEPVVEFSGDLTTPPRTWLGKFFRWFKS